jgi:hypothetical protein
VRVLFKKPLCIVMVFSLKVGLRNSLCPGVTWSVYLDPTMAPDC